LKKEKNKLYYQSNRRSLLEKAKQRQRNKKEELKVYNQEYYRKKKAKRNKPMKKVKNIDDVDVTLKQRKKQEANRKYYQKNKAQIINNAKERAKNRKEEIKDYQKNYYQMNKEKYVSYREKNRDKIKEQYKEYTSRNREKLKEYHREYNLCYGYKHIKTYYFKQIDEGKNLLKDRSRRLQADHAAFRLLVCMDRWKDSGDECSSKLHQVWTKCITLFHEYTKDSFKFRFSDAKLIGKHLYAEKEREKFLDYIRRSRNALDDEKSQMCDEIESYYSVLAEDRNK